MAGNKHWTSQELGILKDHYAHISAPKLIEAFTDRSVRSITGQARRMGLRKSEERKSEMMREHIHYRRSPPNGAA